MTTHAVVIAGGGPTGLMSAAELALARVPVVIVERRTSQDLEGSRAGGLHARSLELLDQRGVVDRFLAAGKKVPVVYWATGELGIGDFPTRHPYTLALFQNHIERLLAEWAAELGVQWIRGVDVTGLAQDDRGVDVALSDGRTLRADWLVGCDGGRSVVRKAAGIAFDGWDASTSALIAECLLEGDVAWGLRRDARGIHGIGKMEDGKTARVVLSEAEVRTGDATLDDLKAALRLAYGTDYGVHGVRWLSRFTDATRQAASYRVGRVLVAGDAAHVHSPAGGQGLNLGLHDAVNLGWKLGLVARGAAGDALLDSYEAERRPVTARAMKSTMAATALNRGDERTTALRELIGEMSQLGGARSWLAGMISGLDVRHDLGGDHPLVGRRMPDLDLVLDRGARRLFTWLHDARAVLVRFAGGATLEGWADRLHVVDARCDGPWELPVVGAIDAPTSVLVRPDGHVAWVSTGSDDGLRDALRRWLGDVERLR